MTTGVTGHQVPVNQAYSTESENGSMWQAHGYTDFISSCNILSFQQSLSSISLAHCMRNSRVAEAGYPLP